jgi:hypothetical protein
LAYYDHEQITKDDITWYYCFASADMGIKSNYMSMINVSLFGGCSDFHDPYNNFILESTTKFRTISKTLSKLSDNINSHLYYSFCDIHYNALVEVIFGKYTGSALFICKREDIDIVGICERIPLGQSTQKDKNILTKVRIAATLNYNNAITEYYKSKPKEK